MRKLILFFVAAMSIAAGPAEPLETDAVIYEEDLEAEFLAVQYAELDGYIDWYLAHYTRRADNAKNVYVPIIVDESKKHGLDPLLMAVIVSFESSWLHKSSGKLNEGGLYQIMPRSPVRRRFKVDTIEGNIRGGVYWFGKAVEMCKGDMKQALSAYQSGRCKPVLKSAKRRWNKYIEALLRHGMYSRDLD